jgi:hypothetical protein
LLNASPRLNLIIVLGLCFLAQGCTPSKPEGSTPFIEEASKDKPLPFNKLLDGSFPPLRQDSFYTTYIDEGGKKTTLNDRFVSSGKGFVAYCEKDGFDDGYYLYNFYGHSSYYVLIKDRVYKVALTSPGDNLLSAYQAIGSSDSRRPRKEGPVITKLAAKKIDGIDCQGISYTTKEGAKHEEWFDLATHRLIDQTVEGPGLNLSRHLKRANAFCETMLLRLPEGFTLEK